MSDADGGAGGGQGAGHARDADRLGRWLDQTDLPGAGEPIEQRFVTGGAQNRIYEIRRGDLHAALVAHAGQRAVGVVVVSIAS